ncbi:MAG: lysozyme, partial [Oscillospiraceae bacterium]|nr:lysozyme [Oscillospiraceae bacterium]
MGTALLLRHAQPEPEEEEPPETVHIGGQDVVINQELNRSDLEEEHFTSDDTGTITYSGSALYGVDVSAHQGEIDWSAVAGDGIDFAILRIGSRGYSAGAIREDACFEQNYTGARENGLLVGTYFFSQAVSVEEAVEEAEQVLFWLDGRALDGPVVYDWETIEDDIART